MPINGVQDQSWIIFCKQQKNFTREKKCQVDGFRGVHGAQPIAHLHSPLAKAHVADPGGTYNFR